MHARFQCSDFRCLIFIYTDWIGRSTFSAYQIAISDTWFKTMQQGMDATGSLHCYDTPCRRAGCDSSGLFPFLQSLQVLLLVPGRIINVKMHFFLPSLYC